MVDDGSQDGTVDVLASAARRLPLRIVRHATPQGRSKASNAGAIQASGDIVIFLDGDMLAGPDLVQSHRRRHAQFPEPVIARGSTWHLRCTRMLLDPEHGEPFPEQAERYRLLPAAGQVTMRVTCDQVRTDFAEIARRGQKAIYPGTAPARLHDAEMAALQDTPDCPVLWAAASGSNQSVRRADFLAAGGFTADIDINEHRELALRMVQRGARMVGVPDARTYHMTHRSGWRDPLSDTVWERIFWQLHPLPAVALLPVFWASLSDHKAIPPDRRILSLGELGHLAASHAGVHAQSAPRCRALMGYPELLT